MVFTMIFFFFFVKDMEEAIYIKKEEFHANI